jgi:hypothetical protein
LPLDAIKQFKNRVDPSKTRIDVLPDIVLAFGGKLSVKQGEAHASCRNVFINHLHSTKSPLANVIICPEHYPEWNKFEHYPDLIAFERDACSLARAIVLFSESEGAFAELGAFCQDEVISDRLLVVVSRAHYKDTSFIALGPIKHIELKHPEGSICVVDSITATKFETEASDVAKALQQKIDTAHKTHQFDPSRIRDQLLLIADLVDLFSAVTQSELHELLEGMGVVLEAKRIKQMINLLQLFELVIPREKSTQRFLVAPVSSKRKSYLGFSAQTGAANFDRARFKLQVFSEDPTRDRIFRQAHGVK